MERLEPKDLLAADMVGDAQFAWRDQVVLGLKDEAGNARRIYDSVVLDREAPTIAAMGFGELYPDTISVGSDGLLHTSSRDFNLLFSVEDNVSETSNLLFTYKINCTTPPETWQTVTGRPVPLHLDYEGVNWINLWFKNEAGNMRWSYKRIVLDLP